MLVQASIETLRMYFDSSELSGSETVYASQNENEIAFAAITHDGKITTYKSDGYPEELLEQEIMMLCCLKYDDNKVHIGMEKDDKYTAEQSGWGILVELIVAAIALILCAVFLLIYWLLIQDIKTVMVIGGIICVPVLLFLYTVIKSRLNGGGR
jgi:hypothetical protein